MLQVLLTQDDASAHHLLLDTLARQVSFVRVNALAVLAYYYSWCARGSATYSNSSFQVPVARIIRAK